MDLHTIARSLRTQCLLFFTTLSVVSLLNSHYVVASIEAALSAEYPGEFNSLLSVVRWLLTLGFFALTFPEEHSGPLVAFSAATTCASVAVFQPEGPGVIGAIVETTPLLAGAAAACYLTLRDQESDGESGALKYQTPRRQKGRAKYGASKLAQQAATLAFGKKDKDTAPRAQEASVSSTNTVASLGSVKRVKGAREGYVV